MRTFLFLEKFITPKLIQLTYWIMMFINIIMAITIISMGISMGNSYYGGSEYIFIGLIGSVIYLIFSVLMTRVFCELILVLFKINDNLTAIREK